MHYDATDFSVRDLPGIERPRRRHLGSGPERAVFRYIANSLDCHPHCRLSKHGIIGCVCRVHVQPCPPWQRDDISPSSAGDELPLDEQPRRLRPPAAYCGGAPQGLTSAPSPPLRGGRRRSSRHFRGLGDGIGFSAAGPCGSSSWVSMAGQYGRRAGRQNEPLTSPPASHEPRPPHPRPCRWHPSGSAERPEAARRGFYSGQPR